jgi:hypothetical protein
MPPELRRVHSHPVEWRLAKLAVVSKRRYRAAQAISLQHEAAEPDGSCMGALATSET